MKIEQGKFCPLIGKDCIGLQCSWFTQVRGLNPNTGEDVDEWGCAVTWLPLMMIDNSNQQRQTGAAIESARNETVRDNEDNRRLIKEVTTAILQKPILPIRVESVDEPINKLEGDVE